MPLDFDYGQIVIRSTGDKWGPFTFDFGDSLPTGETISSATVKSYQGSTETTSYLIESGTTSVGTDTITVSLQYPGSTYVGYHELRFAITTSGTRKNTFRFGYVIVE